MKRACTTAILTSCALLVWVFVAPGCEKTDEGYVKEGARGSRQNPAGGRVGQAGQNAGGVSGGGGGHAGGQIAGGQGSAAPGGQGGGGGSSATTTPEPRATCTGLAACETFEAMNDGPLPEGTFRAVGGPTSKFTVVSDKASGGKKSVKIEVATDARVASLLLQNVDKVVPGGGKTVYARMMIRFEPTVIKTTRDGKDPHWRFIRMAETVPNRGLATVSGGVVGPNRGRLLYNSAGNDCASDGGVVPANKWACVEMRADPQGYEMWIDGESAMKQNTTGAACWQRHGEVQQLAFGFENAAATLAEKSTFWLDDLAVSDKRIGCP